MRFQYSEKVVIHEIHSISAFQNYDFSRNCPSFRISKRFLFCSETLHFHHRGLRNAPMDTVRGRYTRNFYRRLEFPVSNNRDAARYIIVTVKVAWPVAGVYWERRFVDLEDDRRIEFTRSARLIKGAKDAIAWSNIAETAT